MSATAADFQQALAICRAALDHGGEVSGNNLALVVRVIEYGANTLDTTAILPSVMVEPVEDGQ